MISIGIVLELYIEFALSILRYDIVHEQLRGLIVLAFWQHIASLGCRLDIIKTVIKETPQLHSSLLSFNKLHVRVIEGDLHFPPAGQAPKL